MVTLKPDILRIIFQLVHNPLPPRHAPEGSRPDRSSIRQNDLCALLRVSKEFYDIATPILYHTVVTDKFLQLVNRVGGPGVKGVATKIELLSKVQHLYIEYSAKEENPLFSYQDIFENNLYHMIGGVDKEARIKQRDWQGALETLYLITAWDCIAAERAQSKRVLQSVQTLATGAIFGQQEEIWRSIGTRFDECTQWTFAAQRATLDFILHTPSLRHFCQSGSVGALNIGVTYITDLNQNRVTIVSHNHYHDPTLLPTSIGVRSRWYVHTQANHPRCEESMYIRWARMNIEDALNNRHNFAMDRAYAVQVPDWGLVGGVYRNYPQQAGPSAYRRTMEPVMERYRKKLPRWVQAKDDWEANHLKDAPNCDACGWVPDRA